MMSNFFSLKAIFVLFFILVVINLIFLDTKLFGRDFLKDAERKPESTEKSSSVAEKTVVNGCPDSCLSTIYQATSSLKLTQAKSIEKSASQAQSSDGFSSTVKEFFVSFGSGSSSAEDWTDISGLAAYIDSTKYGKIQTVVFEATLRIPTGNQIAWARLFNTTDKHPVWFSEVSIEGGTPKLLISNPITLDSGNKLYQVQIKTQLKSPAILDQARVHITTY